MPSSTSSSDTAGGMQSYDRQLPDKSLGRAALLALLIAILLMGGWEAYWRANDAVPSYRNSEGQWAIQRRRINRGEGHKTVLSGSSRVLFDVQLDVWEQESGERPIQLALEGTTPLPLMEDLADDPDFTGTLVVGIAPDVFLTGFQYRGDAFAHFRDETPTQWLGQRISMVVEPYLAFYIFDFALFTIINRQAWPVREGVHTRTEVRHLFTMTKDRNTRLWSKVADDEEYANIIKATWMQDFDLSGEPDEMLLGMIEEKRGDEIERTAATARKLQEKGVEVIFVRNPSGGDYAIAESIYFPRAENWDVLIEKSGALGIHWQDHEELQGYWLPEWSHMSGSEADRYTKALYHVIQRERLRHKE